MKVVACVAGFVVGALIMLQLNSSQVNTFDIATQIYHAKQNIMIVNQSYDRDIRIAASDAIVAAGQTGQDFERKTSRLCQKHKKHNKSTYLKKVYEYRRACLNRDRSSGVQL